MRSTGRCHERVVDRQRVVEDRAAERRLERDARDDAVLAGLDTLGQLEAGRGHRVRQAQLDRRAEQDLATVEGHPGLGRGRERATRTDAATVDRVGQVVDAGDHVLGRHGHRATVGRLEDVVARQHEDAGLGLRLG